MTHDIQETIHEEDYNVSDSLQTDERSPEPQQSSNQPDEVILIHIFCDYLTRDSP